MECPRIVLVVLTLLQLCRAQQIPQWYSTKINDGFQPKPLSEIFSSEANLFSTANPIVVTEKLRSTVGDNNLLSTTLAPPTSQFESTTLTPFQSITTSMPAGALYQQPHLEELYPLQIDVLPQQVYLQPHLQSQSVQQYPTGPQLVTESPLATREETFQTQKETEQTFTPGPLVTTPTPQTVVTVSTQLPTEAVTKPPLQFKSLPPLQFNSLSPPQFRPPSSNYFLIYQQGANPVFPLPTLTPSTSFPKVTIRETLPTTVFSPLSSTTRSFPTSSSISTTTRTFPTSSFSTTTPLPTTWLSTTPLSTSVMPSSSVTIIPSSSLGVSTGGCITSTTAIPNQLQSVKKAAGLSFPLKIRVVAPKGSITNVHINQQTTTKRPVTKRATTRKPTTRKTSKPKKNNYDRCLDGCRKVKDPICAAPLSHREIDPKTLKGFPSVCHMACHNSYRKEPFEKLMDGRCGKLRTQVRLIDSKNKLRRDELSKNEYSLDQGTVIELSGA